MLLDVCACINLSLSTLWDLLAYLEKISDQKTSRVLNFVFISFRHRQLQDIENQIDDTVNTFIVSSYSPVHQRSLTK